MSFEELLADIDNPAPKRKSDEGGKTRWLGRVKLLATEGQKDRKIRNTPPPLQFGQNIEESLIKY